MSVAEELERLHRLHTSGALSDAEYIEAKRTVLEPVAEAIPHASQLPPAVPSAGASVSARRPAAPLSGGTRFVQWSFGILGAAWSCFGLYILHASQNDRTIRYSERGDFVLLGLVVAAVGAVYISGAMAMSSRRPAAWWVALFLALLQLVGFTPLGLLALVLLGRKSVRDDFAGAPPG
jgi:hypothetical protein